MGLLGDLPTSGPAAATFRRHLGDVLAEKGDYKRARDLDPRNAQRLTRLGDGYSAAEMPDKALRAYQQALREGDGDPEAFVGLGDLARQVANTPVAIKEYRRAVRRQPKRAYYRYKLGVALLVVGAYEEAAAELREALTLAPKDAYYHFLLGEVHLAGGGIDEAVGYFERAVELAPKDEYYSIRLGAAYLRGDRPHDACRAFRNSVDLNPENGSYRVLLASAHAAAGDDERERQELAQAGRLDAYDADFVRRIKRLAAAGR